MPFSRMTRSFVALCRAFDDLPRARVFAFELLREGGPLISATPSLIHNVAIAWPAVLNRSNQSLASVLMLDVMEAFIADMLSAPDSISDSVRSDADECTTHLFVSEALEKLCHWCILD